LGRSLNFAKVTTAHSGPWSGSQRTSALRSPPFAPDAALCTNAVETAKTQNTLLQLFLSNTENIFGELHPKLRLVCAMCEPRKNITGNYLC
jgi:hypothetical protein